MKLDQNLKKIITVQNPKETKILRAKTKEFVFSKLGGAEIDGKILSKNDLNLLILEMRRLMREARGVGLSANQVGLSWRMFVAEVPDNDGVLKLYAIFNPKLEKTPKAKKIIFEEGCLSVPKKYGRIERFSEVKLSGLNKLGKPLKIKAWGLLAHVFQHEVEHLDGKLFIDRAIDIFDTKNQKT